jgi:glycosyltransferase involved in cell wall biosynthesis
MLFPIQWEEPFGLAMIEAMGAGTPVVASRRGAAPEIIDEGLTGFTVDSIEEMADRVRDAALIDPGECAARAHERFSPARMARDYEALFLGEASM